MSITFVTLERTDLAWDWCSGRCDPGWTGHNDSCDRAQWTRAGSSLVSKSYVLIFIKQGVSEIKSGSMIPTPPQSSGRKIGKHVWMEASENVFDQFVFYHLIMNDHLPNNFMGFMNSPICLMKPDPQLPGGNRSPIMASRSNLAMSPNLASGMLTETCTKTCISTRMLHNFRVSSNHVAASNKPNKNIDWHSWILILHISNWFCPIDIHSRLVFFVNTKHKLSRLGRWSFMVMTTGIFSKFANKLIFSKSVYGFGRLDMLC